MLEEDEEDSCFICFNEFEDESLRTFLPCSTCMNVTVHKECIYRWKESRCNSKEHIGTCPLCRGPLGKVDFEPIDPLQTHNLVTFDLRHQFVSNPIPSQHGFVRCYVRVVPSTWFSSSSMEFFIQRASGLEYPRGALPEADGPQEGDRLLLRASKRHWLRTDMSFDTSGSDFDPKGPNYAGSVTSTLSGLEHTIVKANSGEENGFQELAAVHYAQNRIGLGVGPRKMRALLPGVQIVDPERPITKVHRPENKKEGLSATLASRGGDDLMEDSELKYCENREPSWFEAIQAYSLDFSGRVTLPSNKNFQLCMREDMVLQFGKVVSREDINVYTIDFKFPLSPLQAFGICITSIDRKLMCA